MEDTEPLDTETAVEKMRDSVTADEMTLLEHAYALRKAGSALQTIARIHEDMHGEYDVPSDEAQEHLTEEMEERLTDHEAAAMEYLNL